MKKLFLLLSIITFFSCFNNSVQEREPVIKPSKTAVELEDSSIKSGKRIDTLYPLRFIFGMSSKQIDEICKTAYLKTNLNLLSNGMYSINHETKNFYYSNLITFYYFNDKMYALTESVLQNTIEQKNKINSNFKEEILADLKNYWGNKPYKKGTQQNSKYYWLQGNLRVDYLDNGDDFMSVFSDMTLERQLLAEEEIKKKNEQLRLQSVYDSITNAHKRKEEEIVEKLKKKAKRDWPEDYTTQEYWLNEQIRDYNYMKNIPDDDKIKQKAQHDWPLDFSTQKYWYNEQVEAKERLNR